MKWFTNAGCVLGVFLLQK